MSEKERKKKSKKTTSEPVPVELQEAGKKYCGRCRREQVEGKCSACGRPTKYTTDEDMIAKVDAYLATCVDKLEDNKLTVNLPKRVGLANFLDVSTDTLDAWARKSKKFLGALGKIDRLQQERLINSGLSGDYNSTIAKLILSSNHGMAEKTEQDVTSGGEKLDGIAVSFVKPKEGSEEEE